MALSRHGCWKEGLFFVGFGPVTRHAYPSWRNLSCVTTKRDGKTDKKEGKHQKRHSSQNQKERNSPNSSENEEIEAQQELRGTEK